MKVNYVKIIEKRNKIVSKNFNSKLSKNENKIQMSGTYWKQTVRFHIWKQITLGLALNIGETFL